MSIIPRLDIQEIEDAINPAWYEDTRINNTGITWQSVTIWFIDTIGQPHNFTSSGQCPHSYDYSLSPEDRTAYIEGILIPQAAHYLYAGQASEGISNIPIKGYQPQSIY
jgi:hypothetical protein